MNSLFSIRIASRPLTWYRKQRRSGPERNVTVLVAYFTPQPVGIDAVGVHRSAFGSRVGSLPGDRSLASVSPGGWPQPRSGAGRA
jgi:hypothetical protein